MTIKEYLEKLPEIRGGNGESIRDTLAATVSIWSNAACEGYCQEAMRRAGLTQQQRAAVLAELHYAFDSLTVEEAERLSIGG